MTRTGAHTWLVLAFYLLGIVLQRACPRTGWVRCF